MTTLYNKSGTFSTDLFTGAAIEAIQAHPSDKSAFIYIAYTAPHAPYQAPAEFIAQTDAIYENLPSRRTIAAMMANVDHAIGRVQASLEQRDMWKDTVTIILSDNGGRTFPAEVYSPQLGSMVHSNCASRWSWSHSMASVLCGVGKRFTHAAFACFVTVHVPSPANSHALHFGISFGWASVTCSDPLRGSKGAFLEGGIRTPALVHTSSRAASTYPRAWSGILPSKAGTVLSDITFVSDWLPTLLDVAGAPIEFSQPDPDVDGVSLWRSFSEGEYVE